MVNTVIQQYNDKKQREEARLKKARVEKPEKTTMKVLKKIYPTYAELNHAKKCLQDFRKKLANILYYRLQPGHGKEMDDMIIGSIEDWRLFDHFFCDVQDGKRTQRVFIDVVDGERYPSRRFYYSFGDKLPNLGDDVLFGWNLRIHGEGSGSFAQEMCSMYESLKFTVEERTGRVWCKWVQQSAGLSGYDSDGTALYTNTC